MINQQISFPMTSHLDVQLHLLLAAVAAASWRRNQHLTALWWQQQRWGTRQSHWIKGPPGMVASHMERLGESRVWVEPWKC